MKSIYWDIAAFFSGVIMTFSFAPFDQWYIAIFGMGVLFTSWQTSTPKRAALRGLLFGLGLFGVGVSWVFISVYDFGGAGLITSLLITLLFIVFWALFPALTAYIAVRCFAAEWGYFKIMSYAAVWILIEYLRGQWIFNGFPWFQVAYSQLDTPLAGFIPIVGAYGTGWLLVISALTSAFILHERSVKSVLAVVLVVCIWMLGTGLNTIRWTKISGEPIVVTMVQGNVAQDKKWQPRYREKILQDYETMTLQNTDSDLIIWPESAVPAYLHEVYENFLSPLEQKLKKYDTDLVVSVPIKGPQGEKYNSVITLGSFNATYRKIHLLPFGEYFPLQPFSGYMLDSLNILPLGQFTAGKIDQPLLIAAGYHFITSICYEDAFAELGLRGLDQAAFLVNVTNDGWFGNSLEPYQHLQIARMRALEAGRYLLRSTNNGVTAFIAPNGKVLKAAPLFEATAITSKIYPMNGITPYARLRDEFTLIIMSFILVAGLLISKKA